jgi:hypothetical protein
VKIHTCGILVKFGEALKKNWTFFAKCFSVVGTSSDFIFLKYLILQIYNISFSLPLSAANNFSQPQNFGRVNFNQFLNSDNQAKGKDKCVNV